MRASPGGRRVAAVLAASAALALVGGCGHSKKPAIALPTTSSSVDDDHDRPHDHHHDQGRATLPVCPLTGLPPRDGHVPQRAALAVKVENLPEARPQWGLDHADIVFEEPVEGGITRFIAVYQCHVAPRIEPVRSGRLVDIAILEPSATSCSPIPAPSSPWSTPSTPAPRCWRTWGPTGRRAPTSATPPASRLTTC